MNHIDVPDPITSVFYIGRRLHLGTRFAIYKVIPRNGRQPRVKRTTLLPGAQCAYPDARSTKGSSSGAIHNLTIPEGL